MAAVALPGSLVFLGFARQHRGSFGPPQQNSL
jgi:hypothetical protein